MSVFNLCILITRKGASLEQMVEEASIVLAKFDINKEMNPYKSYVSADEIQRMAEFYGIDPANLSELAEKFEGWNGDKGGVDEEGFYGVSTKNPEGHIDEWSGFIEVKPEDRGRLLFGQGGEMRSVRALVTPDGQWVDGPWVYLYPDAEQEKELEKWDKQVTMLLEEHKDALVLLAECRI